MKELKLTLHKKAFDVMVTGEKPDEFRAYTAWIRSRLISKNGDKRVYDTIKFTNGYGATKPYFICEYVDWEFGVYTHRRYSNGLEVDINDLHFMIKCGKILEIGNLNQLLPVR
jgi:hypothetical protein